MKTPKEATSARVANEPKQAEEALRQRWHWVDPAVWTERMLEALVRGVKAGNAYFARHEFSTLLETHQAAIQSHC
jgi:hypothetical protein